jgi:hypothetical protein
MRNNRKMSELFLTPGDDENNNKTNISDTQEVAHNSGTQ